MSQSPYTSLLKIFKEIYLIESVIQSLEWDKEVQMPESNIKMRCEEMSYLVKLQYDKLSNPNILPLIDKAKTTSLTTLEHSTLKIIKNKILHTISVPVDVLQKFISQSFYCSVLWRRAKNIGKIKPLLPEFDILLNLVREIAERKANILNICPYDTLLDMYDRDSRSGFIDPLFNELSLFLKNYTYSSNPNNISSKATIPKYSKQLSLKIISDMGLNPESLVISDSSHPFTTGLFDDVRITNWDSNQNFFTMLFTLIHEAGHALYYQNLPKQHLLSPIGFPLSYTMDEASALFWEKHIARNEFFMDYILAKFNKDELIKTNISAKNLALLSNSFNNNSIRTLSNEVFYNLHIIMRYNIEKTLITNKVRAKDLPDLWEFEYNKTFNDTCKDKEASCLQDIQWYKGRFGNFPVYCLGNIIASQISSFIEKKIPEKNLLIKNGEFSKITSLLTSTFYSHGCINYSTREHLIQLLKEDINIECYKNYISTTFNN